MALTYALISIYNLVLVGFGLGLVNYGLGHGGSGLDSITEVHDITVYKETLTGRPHDTSVQKATSDNENVHAV